MTFDKVNFWSMKLTFESEVVFWSLKLTFEPDVDFRQGCVEKMELVSMYRTLLATPREVSPQAGTIKTVNPA